VEEEFWFDPLVFGKRLRHYRRLRGLTLQHLGDRVGKQASFLSMLEGGKREPRPGLVEQLAQALDVRVADLLRADPPDRRSRLEVALERAQEEPLYERLHLPPLKMSTAIPDAALEHLLGLYSELKRACAPATPTVQEARRASVALREELRRRDNYLGEIEQAAGEALRSVGYPGSGAVAQRMLTDLATHFGFAIQQVRDVPASARAIADLRDRVIYIRQRDVLRTREARSVILQTLGHFALAHPDPEDYTTYLRQRTEANYFAGAVLVPEAAALTLLEQAEVDNDISAEDIKEVFYVSYEMAAHRFCNLATHGLDLRVHFVRSDAQGTIWKAYENDGVPFPSGPDGAIEGERLCREWGTRQVFHSEDVFAVHYQYTETPNGEYWCATHVEADRQPYHAITIGCQADDAHQFRGGDTERRSVSRCPDGPCCRRPDRHVAARWDGWAWAAPTIHSHAIAAVASGIPGVDTAEVYEFLERYSPEG
jgi:predicted transcriptional regulator/transcriptional regulator with XRE-family HTH domain